MDSTNEDVINTPNNVTMLYSGNYQEIPTKRFISENVRHLGKTDAGDFLDFRFSKELKNAIQKTFGEDIKKGTKAYDFVDSLWGDVSERFMKETKGVVTGVIGLDATSDRIFAQRELPILMENQNITSIFGIPADKFRELNLSHAEAFAFLKEHSNLLAHVADLKMENGNVINEKDFLEISEDLDKYVQNSEEKLKRLSDYMSNLSPESYKILSTQYNKLGLSLKTSSIDVNNNNQVDGIKKGSKNIPIIGTLVTLFLIADTNKEAQAAEARGEPERAKDIWAEFLAGEVGSELASTGATFATAAIAVAIFGLSAPVAAAAGIVAGIAAGIWGEDKAKELYQLTKDLDGNGKSDLFDRMSTLLFGQDIKPNQIPDILNHHINTNATRINLDANMSVREFIAKAKEDIAYRYALRELNPFVIEGVNYESFNKDGSLDLLDANHTNGMSESYLNDRATMLLLQMQYLKNGLKLGRDLSSDSIQGDWDFYDYGKHPFAGDKDKPLVFSIDGNGISIDDHIIAFGTKENDTFEGSGESDRLYGGAGDDTFKSGDGDDYMEGGTDFDTYIIEDNDTILDSDNNGQIVIGNTKVFEFKFPQNNTDVWKSIDANGDFDNQFIAVRIFNDLRIRSISNQSDSVTIKDFFSLANSADNTISGLNITLHTAPTEKQPEKGNLWVGDSHPIVDEDGRYPNEWANRDKTGKIINGVEAKDFNDMIQSDNNDSIIKGLGGHDALSGGSGNDLIEGGEGYDMLLGGGGKDTIYGGDGNDFINSSVQLALPRRIRPDDEWKAPKGTNIETLLSATTNTLWGVYTETTNDSYTFHNAKSAFDNLGDDIFGGNGDDIIFGSNHDDYIHGDGYHLDKDKSKIIYESGNDVIYGHGGNDIIYGGLGDDNLNGDIKKSYTGTLQSEHGMDIIYGNEGNDSLRGFGHNDILDGGDGNDYLFGDSKLLLLDLEYHGDDILYGGKGIDQLVGNGGNDTLYGGEGDDTLFGDSDEPDVMGNDMLYGESGNDVLMGGFGNDFLSGGIGDDNLMGDSGNDSLLGDIGNDRLTGELGDDSLFGGEGDDTLLGGLGNDSLSGETGNDILSGNEGNDIIFGGDGKDILLGDEYENVNTDSEFYGNDILHGEAGDDELLGLGGSDQLYGGEGNDKLFGDGADDTSRNDEHVSGQDILDGGEGDDYLEGGRDDDILYGGEGHDTLVGSSGNNQLYGGIGFDTYVINSTDTQTNIIRDDDNKGRIGIDNIDYRFLSWKFDTQTQNWFANGIDIVLKQNSNRSLSFFNKNNDEIAIIENFTNGALGIHLEGTTSEVPSTPTNPIPNPVPKNKAPSIVNAITPKNAKSNEIFEQNLGQDLFTDEDSHLTYSVTLEDGSPLPAWLNFDSNTMTLRGTPSSNDIGILNVKITATDKEGLSNHQTWSFQVEPQPNTAPTLITDPVVISTIQENEQVNFSFAKWFDDDKGFNHLNFNLGMADGSALPSWLNGQDDHATLTPDFNSAGTYRLHLTAQDAEGLSQSLEWQINVNNVNRAPTVSGSLNTQNLRVGENWQLTLPTLFSDADTDDKLSYHLEMADGTSVPTWLKFDAQTQTLSGNPTATGNIHLKLIATDTYNESVSAPINLLINPEPEPPMGIKKAGTSGNDTLVGTNGSDVLEGGFGNDQLHGLNGHDTLIGGSGSDTLMGGNGNDKLDGGFDNDTLHGGNGNDHLDAGFGDDVLIGGQGNDALKGGMGNDTYIFNLGDGQDTIHDSLGKDILKINGLRLSDVLFTHEGNDLIIDSKISDDQVTIENFYFYSKDILNLLKPNRPTELGDKIETFVFADGQSLNYAEVDRMVQALEQQQLHSTY